MVGFFIKKVKKTGLFEKHIFITYICPSCKKTVKELPVESLTETNYGYKFNDIELSHCSCGYHANFIIKNIPNNNLNLTFKKTCRECHAIWNFTSNDVKLSGYKQMASIGSPFSDNIKESNLNRCEKCGSRKVTIELLQDNIIKNYTPTKTKHIIKENIMDLFGKKEIQKDLIKSYGILYLGGHPNIVKAKHGKIIFNLFKSKFELVSTSASAQWFTGFSIPYNKVIDLQIVQRQVGSVERVIGGKNSQQLNQLNNIHIKYIDENDNEILLRLEMLSGITVMGQVKKCLEFEDVIRLNHIKEQFKNESNENVVQPQNIDDITSKIEKLAVLCEKNFITKEEFQAKKIELLSRI